MHTCLSSAFRGAVLHIPGAEEPRLEHSRWPGDMRVITPHSRPPVVDNFAQVLHEMHNRIHTPVGMVVRACDQGR